MAKVKGRLKGGAKIKLSADEADMLRALLGRTTGNELYDLYRALDDVTPSRIYDVQASDGRQAGPLSLVRRAD